MKRTYHLIIGQGMQQRAYCAARIGSSMAIPKLGVRFANVEQVTCARCIKKLEKVQCSEASEIIKELVLLTTDRRIKEMIK